jgi:tRNA uridine 5-carboxymethylaminomethyl modification enzyme
MLLRQDNADQRLTKISHDIGLASHERLAACEIKYTDSSSLISFLKKQSILPSEINSILDQKNSAKIKQSGKADKILSRPNIFLEDLKKCNSISSFIDSNNLPKEVQDQAEIQIKYSGYIEKEKANADKLNRLESVKIPKDFDYKKLKSISAEALEKLRKIKPETISQASRISGVSPNDISVLLVFMGR